MFFLLLVKIILGICLCDKPPLTTLSKISPGIGYSSFKGGMVEEACYLFHVSWVSQNFSTTDYFTERPLSYINLVYGFGLKLSGNVFMTLQTSLLTQYLNNVRDTQYSLGYHFISKKITQVKNEYKSHKIEDILTAKGERLFKAENLTSFYLNCGDYLVNSFDLGKALVVSIRVIFNSKSDRLTYEGFYFQYDDIENFIPSLVENLRTLYIKKVEIEVFAIQIGGTQKNDLIKSAMEKNQCLINKCSISDGAVECHKDVREIRKFVVETFRKEFKEGPMGYSPMENFSLGESIEDERLKSDFNELSVLNSFAKAYKIELTRLVEKLNRYRDEYEYIRSHYPFKRKTIERVAKKLDEIYKYLIRDNKLYNCYSDIVNIKECTKEIIAEVNWEEEIVYFSSNVYYEISSERVYQFSFDAHFCLPDNFSWSDKGVLEIHYVNTREYYIMNNIGLICSAVDKDNFTCTDDIFTLNFTVVELQDPVDTAKLLCNNVSLNTTSTTLPVESTTSLSPYAHDAFIYN